MKKTIMLFLLAILSSFGLSSQINTTFDKDSLKGFDEKSVKINALNNNIYGREYANYLVLLKRDFINKKYKIGSYAPQSNLPQTTNNRPSKYSPATVNVAPCVNEGFESTAVGTYAGATNSVAVTGWTIQNQAVGTCPVPSTVFNPGSPEFSIVATPVTGLPGIGTLFGSPFGGNNVSRLNDISPTGLVTKISQSFPVTTANTLFQFAFAGMWQDGTHDCCTQAGLKIVMKDCLGNPISCSSISLNAVGANCTTGATGYSQTVVNGSNIVWTNWQVKYIDLTPFIGSCVTIEFINSDCTATGHYGSVFIDTQCGGQLVGLPIPSPGGQIIGGPVSYCSGSGVATIAAPLGYGGYQWYGPGMVLIPAPQGTLSVLTVTNPIQGSVYTVDLTTQSGCVFVSSNTIQITQVNIVGLGSSSTCANGASGSATVVGNGSGSGYTYTWTNSSNSVVGTNSVVNNLPAGVYTITIGGLGAAGCGTATASTTITTAPPGIINIIKPYCPNSIAVLSSGGGSNFQWYNNSTLIPSNQGGTASNYTVTSPSSGAIYWLSYLSSQGCQDSVKFTLFPTVPGNVSIPYNKLICPGGTNGVVTVSLSPAPGAATNQFYYSVVSSGTTSAYSSSVFPTTSTQYTFNNLSAGGTYSVITSDGTCYYSTTFTVPQHIWTYSVTPSSSPTLCPGNNAVIAAAFSSPPATGQYTYSWTPSTWFLTGNTFQNSILSPVLSPGTTSTVVYSVVVTPTLSGCSITKTVAITAVNPPIPTITAIPNLCNNSAPYVILTSPPNGTFVNSIASAPIGSLTGIITPTNAAIGNNTFTYSIKVYTCSASSVGNFQVSQFYTSALTTPTISPLCVTNAPFNLMNITQNTVNGTWSGTGVQSNSFVPSGLTTNNYVVSYITTSSPNPTVCPSTTTLNISVTNTIIPSISAVNPFCNNIAPFNMIVSPSGGTWYGNAAISTNGSVTPTLATVPTSTASYSVAIGPCVNINTITLQTSNFNTAGFTQSIPSLCFNSTNFNLMSIVQNTNGTWSGTNVSNNAFSPVGLQTGTYVLTYNTTSTPNAQLCPDTKTIAVSLLNPIAPSIVNVGPVCSTHSPIQLTVTPNNGSWVTSPFISANGVFNPSLANIGSNNIQYVVGTPTCNVSQIKNIMVEAFVPATINGFIPDLCNNSVALNLAPLALSNIGSWSGPGVLGSIFNPSIPGAGSFIITHNTASSPSGLCPDQATLSINVYSLQAPSITQAGPFCDKSMPIKLQATPVGGIFGGANNVVSLDGLFNPAYGLIGNNYVNYSVTSGPCVANAQVVISVEKFISADFAKYAGPFCADADPINLNSIVQNPGGNWSGPGMTLNMFDPKKANFGNNVITYYTHSLPHFQLCPDQKTITIQVNEMPNVSVTSNIYKGCSPVEAVLNVSGKNDGKVDWVFGDGYKLSTNGLSVTHIYTTPGEYNVDIKYSDEIGCSALSTIKNKIVVYETPKADFLTDPSGDIVINSEVQFVNLTKMLSSSKYEWQIDTYKVEDEVNPKVTFSQTGYYKIVLMAKTVNDCKDQITKTIFVKNDFQVYIPNSFTPNFDGINDTFIPVFTPYGLDPKGYTMEIYDRWGAQLFQTSDMTKGWTGTIQNKGLEPMKQEVYVYKIRYKDMDGIVYDKMGHVTLLK